MWLAVWLAVLGGNFGIVRFGGTFEIAIGHIKGVTISVIIVCTAIVIIIIIIHNVGMCGSIPNRNWTVVMVVIVDDTVCHPIQGGVLLGQRYVLALL